MAKSIYSILTDLKTETSVPDHGMVEHSLPADLLPTAEQFEDEEKLKFIKEHNILLSTSLDGDKEIHDKCRKLRLGGSSYDLFIEKLDLTKKHLAQDKISSLLTISAVNIDRLKEVVDEYVPKTLERVDRHMVATRGHGIFEAFGPSSATRIRRHPFQSAVYAGPSRELTIASVVPYSKHVPLRAFLNPVVKHTENNLRELTGFRGRLRGYTLEPDVRSVIDQFIIGSSRAVAPAPG